MKLFLDNFQAEEKKIKNTHTMCTKTDIGNIDIDADADADADATMQKEEQEQEHDVPAETQQQQHQLQLTCDYLIVGAGTACMSFVDTLLTRLPDATFVIVDRNSGPGGHWTQAYPFVRLHQQSCNYGVNSLPLGKVETDGRELYDISDRATGKEICEYYGKVIDQFKATGRVRTYFEANYEGEIVCKSNSNSNSTSTNSNSNSNSSSSDTFDSQSSSNNNNKATKKITHAITQNNGQRIIHVECTKIVQCETNVVVPSMRKSVPFAIDESVVKTVPLNELPNYINGGSSPQEDQSQDQDHHHRHQSSEQYNKYLVIGAGKSGVDAITYLLEEGKVDPDQITWIVSRSVWYMMRDGIMPTPKPGTKYWKRIVRAYFDPICAGSSVDEVFLNMERAGTLQRVDADDENDTPQVFKGPNIAYSELANLRSLKNVVKNKGRIKSITSSKVIFEEGDYSIPFSPSDTLVVDCMADNLYGYLDFGEDFKFFNPHKIRLGPMITLFNPSHSSAQIAFLESEFHDDEVKNSFLFFPCGEKEVREMGYQQLFILQWYGEMKTAEQFDKYKPWLEFKLASRTDMSQPTHHGGLLGLMWALFGPTKLAKKVELFKHKMQHGGYTDWPTAPLTRQAEVDPKKFADALRTKTESKASSKTNTTNNNTTLSSSSKKSSGSVFCCRNADAVIV